jgi:tRNA pseudouridine55 synthase
MPPNAKVTQMTPGLYLMHKPVGPTSFSLVQECIAQVKARAPDRRPRVCHGGTLDPFASGLLLMMVGSATRLFDHLHAIPKVYRTTIRWGVETDNGDPLGKVVSNGDASGLSAEKLEEVLATFDGWHEQVPPATSGKRIGGERAYVKAHRGETVEMPPSRVYLHAARWLGHELPERSELEITVRGGYYVRALARDMGRILGCGAHLETLRRTAIGPYVDPGPGKVVGVHGRMILPWAPLRTLTDHDVGELRQDRVIGRGDVWPADWSPPADFPDPRAPVRGRHRGKLSFLLTPREEGLAKLAEFPGGL